MQSLEGKDGILSVSLTHGFPWGDVPEMGTKVLVYADGDPAKAQQLARQLADELIAMRDQLSPVSPGIDAALDEALAFAGGPVVLADGADNPGGGAASDSTFILRRLVERGIGNAAVGPMWDPIAARIATEAGVGARLMLRIGGKVSALSGEPLDLEVTVKALHEDLVQTGLADTPTSMGRSALVEANGIEILLCTLRNQAMGSDLFTRAGCDLASKKIVVVKSSQHFYASYSQVAKHVIYADAPGSVARDINTLPFRKVRRPLWPLKAAVA
jgi:microcystin degradation protein MlrC